MSEEAVKPASTDPLKSVADALDAAVQAAKQGVDQVAATASGAIPAASGFLAGLTYKACYAISYGVVFPSVFVARVIPKENAVLYGFVDGAHAALDVIDEMKSKSLNGKATETSLQDQGTDATPCASGT